MAPTAPHLPYTAQMSALIAGLEGDRAAVMAHIARVDIGALDGHHMFHLAESLAIAGETERAMRMLEDAVDHNFYGFASFCTFLEPLRNVAGFERVLAKAADRVAAFSA